MLNSLVPGREYREKGAVRECFRQFPSLGNRMGEGLNYHGESFDYCSDFL